MIKLKRGIFDSVASGFSGVVNFLISYTSGKFHAATSDGASYSEIDPLVFGTSNINDIEYAPDLTTPATSISFGTWTTRTSNFITGGYAAQNIINISYGNGIWAAAAPSGSTIRRSTDTVTWTTSSTVFDAPRSLVYNSGLWVAVGGGSSYRGSIYSSTDAISWTSRFYHNTNSSPCRDVAYGNGIFVSVAGGTFYTFSGGNSIQTSTNGISWSYSGTGPAHIWDVAYGNGVWVISVAPGSNQSPTSINTSTDIITWTSRSITLAGNAINDIAYGNNKWIIVGATGQMTTSTDAITWTTLSNNFGSTNIQGIYYDNSYWVATGDVGELRISTDTVTWTTQTSNFGATNINTVYYGNNIWAIAGNAGQLRTSLNTTSTTYPNNTILAAGNDGKAARSTNGISWATINTGATSNLTAISFVTTSATTQAYFVGGI